MSNLDQLRAFADDGSPHSRAYRHDLAIAVYLAVRRMTPVQRRLYLSGRPR